MQDVQGRFSPIDESHTRVDVSGDDDAGMEVEKAAGNPGALGVAPGSAGGGKPGTTQAFMLVGKA